MVEDISKSTIIVLVVLTVVISALGTWTVLSEVDKMESANSPAVKSSQTDMIGQGKVSLTNIDSTKVPVTTGKVIFQNLE
ncbi:MAG: hypothetical protein ABIC91_07075 [Nanoarchaeota archaeon]|nr:hypothetical protein [Nanoarchaeota archaeon]MBU1850615.1 hypothetical protein [Nanoarchaeota archaeon]